MNNSDACFELAVVGALLDISLDDVCTERLAAAIVYVNGGRVNLMQLRRYLLSTAAGSNAISMLAIIRACIRQGMLTVLTVDIILPRHPAAVVQQRQESSL